MATAIGKSGVAFSRLWHLVDAKGQVLGRMSRGIATVLTGEHKPVYDPTRTFMTLTRHFLILN